MRLAPSRANVDGLRQVAASLDLANKQTMQCASAFLTQVGVCMDGMTRGDAESLRDVALKATGDVRRLAETAAALVQETRDLADELEAVLQKSLTGDTGVAGQAGAAAAGGQDAQKVQAAKAKLQAVRGMLNKKEINPFYGKFKPYGVNCGSCAFALWRRMTGADPQAKATQTNVAPHDEDMELITGLKCTYMKPDDIANILKQRGPGSHLIVGINRTGGSGHWFNAYYDGEKIYTLDGQCGKVFDWPHDYGHIRDWCAMV